MCLAVYKCIIHYLVPINCHSRSCYKALLVKVRPYTSYVPFLNNVRYAYTRHAVGENAVTFLLLARYVPNVAKRSI